MKLIIDIDEETYDEIKKIVINGNEMCFIYKLIANGTPLENIKAEIDKARYIDKDTRICKNALASGLEVAMEIIDKHISGKEKE